MSVFNQQTLSFNIGGEEVISRPFDFEAMCLMNDIHSQGGKGKYSICINALPYMFEGTKVTNDVLKKAEISKLAEVCDKLWEIYAREMQNISKSKSKNAQSPVED